MSERIISQNLTDGLTALFNKLGYDVKIITNTARTEKPAEEPVEQEPKTSELLEKLSAKFSQLSAEIDTRVAEWHKEIDDLKEQVYQLWNIVKVNEKEQEREAIKPAEPKRTESVKAEDHISTDDLIDLVVSFFK